MNQRSIAGGAAALLLMAVAAWAWDWFDRGDPALAEIKELAAAPQTDSNRQAMREVMEERTEGMTDEQRMEYFMNSLGPIFMPMMAARFEQEYDKFMAMSPEEQRRKMDERIDAMSAGGARRGMGGLGGSRPGGPRSGGSRPQIDPAKMDVMRKKMLDWITPDQRSKFENGMQMMAARMRERGMTPPDMRGGGFF